MKCVNKAGKPCYFGLKASIHLTLKIAKEEEGNVEEGADNQFNELIQLLLSIMVTIETVSGRCNPESLFLLLSFTYCSTICSF